MEIDMTLSTIFGGALIVIGFLYVIYGVWEFIEDKDS